ncbi:hypothetical protein KIJ96_05420 [Pseudoalteromonas piscicida]|uniref:hypothetical protein n=1 Tax=Pseudoalteromonas piscicida TaxID=43662 RepID=UPI001D0B38A7|nr:hypothetical protein [Pseudoalteromonas piscicida]UDM62681.1 hypothetical protein KIJ96_05420 [Pseudoalteromonas piscicida]
MKKHIVATTLYREETHRSSGFYVAKKHTVAATLYREETHRSSDFMSRPTIKKRPIGRS